MLGAIGHALQRNVPASWRTNSNIWDFWSHIGNVPDSVVAVSGTSMVIAFVRQDLFSTVPLKRAASTAALGLAFGLGMNAAYDAPVLAETAIVQTLFPGGDADPLDLPYGGTAAIAEAGLLAWAGSRRTSASLPSDLPSANIEHP